VGTDGGSFFLKFNDMNLFGMVTAIGVVLFIPVTAGMLARKRGRNFWMWLLISIPLQTFALAIMIWLPAKKERRKKILITSKTFKNAQAKKSYRIPAYTGSRKFLA
jgi:hypothetical protein